MVALESYWSDSVNKIWLFTQTWIKFIEMDLLSTQGVLTIENVQSN